MCLKLCQNSTCLAEEIEMSSTTNIRITAQCFNVVQSFWPMEELEELEDGPTGYGEMARGGFLFA